MSQEGTVFAPGRSKNKKKEHGVDYAAYFGGPGEPYYRPVLVCICGFSTDRCLNWEEAGRQLDGHLKKEVITPSQG